jgi:hypothetical protein
VVDLGLEDEDGQGVDEADHHRAGDEPHQPRDAGEGEDDLDEAAEQDSGNQVVIAVVAHDRCDDEGYGARGCGDHRRPTAEERDRDGHRERGEQPDPGVDAGDDRERDRLRDQRQRHDEAGEDLGPQQLGGSQGSADRLVVVDPVERRVDVDVGQGTPPERDDEAGHDPAWTSQRRGRAEVCVDRGVVGRGCCEQKPGRASAADRTIGPAVRDAPGR